MKNAEYRVQLDNLKKDQLVTLYNKTFGQKPRSRAKIDEIREELFSKFQELNTSEEANEPIDTSDSEIQAETQAETPAKDPKPKTTSRRGTIIQMVQEGIWDMPTLAEALNCVNENWPVGKNKSAISGTLADMRKNSGWIAKTGDDGRICIILPKKQTKK